MGAICVETTDRGEPNYWVSDSLRDQRQARVLCQGCPLQIECAIMMRQLSPTFGVWAGIIINEERLEEPERNGKERDRKAVKAVR